MSALRSSLWAFAFLVFLFGVYAEAQKAGAVLFFGDSHGDPGNNNHIPTLIKSNFLPYGKNFVGGKPTGRFSDGKILPDYLVAGLGIKELLPAYLDRTGLDRRRQFLLIGDGIRQSHRRHFISDSNVERNRTFQGISNSCGHAGGRYKKKAAKLLNSAVAFISIGTNDFIANYFLEPIRPSHFTVSQYVDFLWRTLFGYIEELYSLDVRRVGVINLPPLGCLPFEKTLHIKVGGKCDEKVNEAAAEYNEKLISTIDGLKAKLPGLKIVSLKYYDIVLDA